jgi:hypothetical protein
MPVWWEQGGSSQLPLTTGVKIPEPHLGLDACCPRTFFPFEGKNMSNNTNAGLIEGHVYSYGNLLLEAAYCDSWTLNLLTALGEDVPDTDGSLIAFELRADGQWDSVYCSVPLFLPEEEGCVMCYGDTVTIDLEELVHLAGCRSKVQDILLEQECERRIRELMATIEW